MGEEWNPLATLHSVVRRLMSNVRFRNYPPQTIQHGDAKFSSSRDNLYSDSSVDVGTNGKKLFCLCGMNSLRLKCKVSLKIAF
jgi:hypothetical protein